MDASIFKRTITKCSRYIRIITHALVLNTFGIFKALSSSDRIYKWFVLLSLFLHCFIGNIFISHGWVDRICHPTILFPVLHRQFLAILRKVVWFLLVYFGLLLLTFVIILFNFPFNEFVFVRRLHKFAF